MVPIEAPPFSGLRVNYNIFKGGGSETHSITFHSSEGCKTSAIAEVSACNLNGFSTTHARGAMCRACRTSESVAAVQKISGKDCVVG